ncbi:MAG: hypothetical protein KDA65_05135, partial [Planctomycetaceae bacterium]|nr:hypothetical protein [Planctomycetaceae bacterium]
MTKLKSTHRGLFALSMGFICVMTFSLSANSIQAETLEDVLDAQNIAKMNAVISYIEQNPEAEDIDQAYSVVFQLADLYDQTEQALPLAEKYLESERKPAEARAICIQIKSLANEEKIED